MGEWRVIETKSEADQAILEILDEPKYKAKMIVWENPSPESEFLIEAESASKNQPWRAGIFIKADDVPERLSKDNYGVDDQHCAVFISTNDKLKTNDTRLIERRFIAAEK